MFIPGVGGTGVGGTGVGGTGVGGRFVGGCCGEMGFGPPSSLKAKSSTSRHSSLPLPLALMLASISYNGFSPAQTLKVSVSEYTCARLLTLPVSASDTNAISSRPFRRTSLSNRSSFSLESFLLMAVYTTLTFKSSMHASRSLKRNVSMPLQSDPSSTERSTLPRNLSTSLFRDVVERVSATVLQDISSCEVGKLNI